MPEWIKTLPQWEQDKYWAAQNNNYKWREEAIAQGRMVMDENNNYIWASEEEFHKNKPHDPVAVEYFYRYLEECNVEFHQTPVFLDEEDENS